MNMLVYPEKTNKPWCGHRPLASKNACERTSAYRDLERGHQRRNLGSFCRDTPGRLSPKLRHRSRPVAVPKAAVHSALDALGSNGDVWDLPAIPGMVVEGPLTVGPDIRAYPQTLNGQRGMVSGRTGFDQQYRNVAIAGIVDHLLADTQATNESYAAVLNHLNC